ncbi:MAG: DUF4238 domain-containing protein [Armatimonadetes bacterium]|nr:DUF4238 domain-containing protein [Armatimonadota bacterium]
MPDEPPLSRKHHVVPKFLLANFTDNGTTSGELWRFDTELMMKHKRSPGAVGYIQDFYNVGPSESLDDAYERAYQQIEHNAAPVIRKLRETRQVPTGTDFEHLIAFVASLERRGPLVKKLLDRFMDDISQHALELLVAHYPEWIEQYRAEHGEEVPPTKEELEDAVRKGLRFEMANSLRVPQAYGWAEHTYPLMVRRPWSLWVRDPGACEFILSDSPVALEHIDRSEGFWQPPPFGPGSFVTLPLDPDMALVSPFEGEPGTLIGVQTNIVAAINLATGRNSVRYLFSRMDDFLYKVEDGKFDGWDHLLARIRDHRSAESAKNRPR